MLAVLSQTILRAKGDDAETGPPLLSAASGLVQRAGRLYIIADDEQHLAVFDAGTRGEGRWVRLFEGELPPRPKQRKAAKADLETLLELPACSGLPYGALLALGSGSRANRCSAALVEFDGAGELMLPACRIDLRSFYEPLQRACGGELNVEGAVFCGTELLLLQRANQGIARNMCLHFAWSEVAPWLLGRGDAIPQLRAIVPFDLGTIDAVPLGFTDATALPDGGWLFSAAAEATADAYADGDCAGSAIGVVAGDGRSISLQRLEGRWKVEGIAAKLRADEDALELTLVTDADTRSQPASCLTVRMPRPR